MKNLALVDLDGTLFNTTAINYSAYNEILKEFNCNIDYEYFEKNCNGKYYKDFISKIIKLDEKDYEYIHNKKKRTYCNYLKLAKKNDHLFNMLKLLKNNYYIALVTTASKKNAYEILKYFDEFELFDLILTQEDIKEKKPNPEGFLKAMEHFNISSDKTIIFEDSSDGIEAANKTGATVFVAEKF